MKIDRREKVDGRSSGLAAASPFCARAKATGLSISRRARMVGASPDVMS